jgi:hypothetical protein
MLKSNLLEAISTFSPKEMKELGEFVCSPFFNKNKNVIKLFEIIRKYYPALDSDKLSKENAYTKLFPGEKYKDSSMRLLMFYLYEVVEKFLAYGRYTRNELTYKKNLLAEFNERNLFKEFEKTYDEIKDGLAKLISRDESYYLDSFELANQHFDYMSKIHSDKYDKYMTRENLEKRFNHLTYAYLISFLKFYTATLNTYHILNVQINMELFENMLGNFAPELFEDVPVIKIYYYAALALLKPELEEYYFKLKELILKHEEILGERSLEDLFINLENYCTRKVRAGKTEFLKENFEIYKIELQKNLYKSYGIMSTAFYTSVVNVGCRLKEYDFLKDFIEKYKNELPNDSRESIYNFCVALYETDLHNFEKALEFLSKVKTDQLYLKMDVRMLQCRLYYELNWDDSLESLLDAFKRTLANNKMIPDFRKLHYSNFLKYLGRLASIRHKADELDLDVVRKQMMGMDNFYHRTWMLGKIEELEKKLSSKTISHS